ncbi:LAFA_0G07976g1_1 [Lachancea sp. 'fantastica']|nr:LAFA_0G07976g1_1 [Lachancea sp. 'fantastica']
MSFGNRSKTPCKYFQQGRCKKGNNCNFAHVYTNNSNGNGNGNGGKTGGGDLYQNFINPSNLGKYAKEVEDDMTTASELKFQPLTSSYGLGNPCAVNLIQDRDLSPEESRFLYYQSQLQNAVPTFQTQMQARASDSQFCRNFVAADTRKAARFLQLATQKTFENGVPLAKGFIEKPLDLTGNSYSNTAANSGASNLFGSTNSFQNPFGQQTSGFSQTGTFGTTTTTSAPSSSGAFGQPTFGSTGAGGAFGQPKFGSSGTQSFGASPFGTASFGAQAGSSAFGGGANAFGSKPAGTPFGAAPGSFGSQTSAPAASNPEPGKPAFGSAFGQPSFGSTSAPQAPAFGSSAFAPSAAGSQTSSAFGKPAFAPNAAGPQASSAFGKPAFGTVSSSSPFGSLQNTQTASPFGSIAKQPSTAATPSPFGTSNAVGTSQKPAEAPKPFGFGQNNATSGGFLSAPAGNPFTSVQLKNTLGQNTTQPQANTNSFGTGHSNQSRFVQGLSSAEEPSETDLPKEVIDYFRADRFELGKVPDIAPPSVLIN